MSPKQSRQSRPTRSPEVIEAALAAQRDQLVGDVEQLAARMAPQALTATARRSAQATAAEWRRRAGIRTARLKERVGLVKDDPLVREGGTPAGSRCPGRCGCVNAVASKAACLSPVAVRDRLARLIGDARDGEPVSLSIVTGAIVVLAGVSAVATVKAGRR